MIVFLVRMFGLDGFLGFCQGTCAQNAGLFQVHTSAVFDLLISLLGSWLKFRCDLKIHLKTICYKDNKFFYEDA